MSSIVVHLKPSEDRLYCFGMSEKRSGDKSGEDPAEEYHLGQSYKVSRVIFWWSLKIISESHYKRGTQKCRNVYSRSTTNGTEYVLSPKLDTRWITLSHASISLNMLFGPFAWNTSPWPHPTSPKYPNFSLLSKSTPLGSPLWVSAWLRCPISMLPCYHPPRLHPLPPSHSPL